MRVVALFFLLAATPVVAVDLNGDIQRVRADLAQACRDAQAIALGVDGGVLRERIAAVTANGSAYQDHLARFTLVEAERMLADPNYRLPECQRAAVEQRIPLLMLVPTPGGD